MNIELKGTATKQELLEVIALKGVASTLGQLGNTEAQRIIDSMVYQASSLLNSLPEAYQDEAIMIADPADTARMFRELYEPVIVRNCKIGKGKTFGMYKVFADSKIPVPRASMPKNALRVYQECVNNGIIKDGIVLKDFEVKSRNIAASLATGAAANANKILSGLK